jgi:hypothetical protein
MATFGVRRFSPSTISWGRQFDVTRERIRQIEAKALRKLRHPSRAHKLSNNTTSRAKRITTPVCVNGVGAVGILRGAGVIQY